MSEGRPSHLELERFVLGELSAEDTERVAQWLDSDPALAAAHREIVDRPSLPLLPLPRQAQARLRPGGVVGSSRLTWLGLPALTATAAVILLRVAVPQPDRDSQRTKGSLAEPTITLVAERHGRLREAPKTVSSEDRIRILVTCDPNDAVGYDVVVVESSLTSFPLPRGRSLPCGNQQTLPGAFRIEADGPVRVCLVKGPSLPSRRELSHHPPDGDGCIRLTAELK